MNPAATLLDVSDMPFWRRLPSILHALDALEAQREVELVVDLDPWPLKEHLALTRPGCFTWEPLEDGPQRWRVRLRRL